MENASKALLIGAGTLIAILILAIATGLFRAASGVAKTYDQTMQSTEITKFNTNFTKYLDAGVKGESGNTKRESANIYDVISLSNFAKDYNNNFSEETVNNNSKAIVHIDIKNVNESTPIIADVQNYSKKAQNYLISQCYYQSNAAPNAKSIITFKIKIEESNETGRIIHASFIPDTDISLQLQEAESLKNTN